MEFKRALTTIAGGICESSLLRPCVRRSALRSFNVVYYHFIGDPAPHYQSFYGGCNLKRFADDLGRLSRVFGFAPLHGLFDRSEVDRPMLAVTFDDGFDLGRDEILEILDQYGVRATSFVITSCIGNRKLMWRHMLSAIRSLSPPDKLLAEYNTFAVATGRLPIRRPKDFMSATAQWDMKHKDEWANLLWKRCNLPPIEDYLAEKHPYFEWPGLRRWIDAGHSVGFHTHTHPFCSRLVRNDLESELIEPAVSLKRTLGVKNLYLSYPFGDRLQPDLEREVFEKDIFKALFGIRGFQRKNAGRDKLERAGIENRDLGWGVFASHFLDAIGMNSLTKGSAA